MRWVRHVGRMGERRYAYWVVVGNLTEGGRREGLGVNERIILK